VTTCVAVAAFPEESIAFQVTVVLPIEKYGGASFVTDSTPTASLTDGSPRSIELRSIVFASIVTSWEQ
jgi:hypothetical protein